MSEHHHFYFCEFIMKKMFDREKELEPACSSCKILPKKRKIFLEEEFFFFRIQSLRSFPKICIQNKMKKMEGSRQIWLKMTILLILFLCIGSQKVMKKDLPPKQVRQKYASNLLASCLGLNGCVTCGEDGRCLECRDDTSLVDGQCQCSSYGKSFDANGECIYCLTKDCATCQAGTTSYMTTCAVCEDPAAGPVDGKCVCPTGQTLVDGTCQSCPAPLTNGQCVLCEQLGCKQCSDSVCTQCIDVWLAYIQEGQCKCWFSTSSLNAEGFCTKCNAEGCKVCEADEYYSKRCHECMDPNAILNADGKCVCPEGQGLSSEGMCEGCDAGQLWIDGICHPPCQSVLGCKTCDDRGVCVGCLNDYTTRVENGECVCNFYGWELNVEGYCVDCRAIACTLCGTDDGHHQILNCAECNDGFTLVDGKCRCSAGQLLVGELCEACPVALNDDGECVPCSLHGCLLCSDGVTCDKCIDDAAEVKDGQCSCRYSALSLNIEGYCTMCQAIGCKTCKADFFKSYQCEECIDPRATVVDSKCTCPDGEGLLDNGFCQPCRALGCEFCVEGNPDVCQKCIGAPVASINDEGNCQCLKFADQKPNSEGICEKCFVEGCLSCVAGQTYTCSLCVDEQNTDLIGGRCVCKTGAGINDVGYCQQCNVAGCASCKTGDNAICERCATGFYLEDGRCECNSPSNKINQHGYCSTCSVLGCKSCLAADASQCLSCYDGAKLVQNSCFCDKSGEAANEKGKCSACFVAGCMSCSSQNPYECLVCSAHLSLQSGICSCANSGQKINLTGECEACNVEGCQSCQTGNPDVCAKCFDCDAFLVDGRCSCPDDQIWSSSLNQCSEQAIASKLSASLRLKKECPENCDACDGVQCSQCQEGFYLKQFDNQCMPCNPKCRSCVDGVTCEVPREGWTTFRGVIKHCDVLHCAECPERVGKCEKCKENYVLINELKCEFSPKSREIHEDNGNFSEFKRKYNKTYESEEEEKFREEIYQMRYEEMKDLSKILPFKVGENMLFDFTEQEMQKRSGYHPPQDFEKQLKSAQRAHITLSSSVPTSLNWTERGAVTSVKDQASCGSCWAFGAAAGTQSALIMMKRATKEIDLSQQYLLECSLESGCDGTGDMDEVMNLTREGVPTEQSYPYDPHNIHPGICSTQDKVFISSSYSHYYSMSEEEIKVQLQNGPMVAHVAADNWEYYESGVFQCLQDQSVNHIVLLTGYTENAWIIKNQWGEDWGENGYMKITNNKNFDCRVVGALIRHDLKVCEAAGCVQCETDVAVCTKCHATATLQNDICICSQPNHVFSSSGACVPCQVFGCEQCQESNPTVCATCDPTMTLTVEGFCECTQASHKFTKEQTCVLCEVEGCQFCQSGQQSVCTKCTDCSAYLSEGKCYCKQGFIMNELGICEREGCPSGEYEENGDCYPCTIDNCAECSDSTTCMKCSEGKSLNEGICQACPVGKYEADGVCIPCSIAGCLSCSSANTCLQCADQYLLRGGDCTECEPGLYLENQQCLPCQISYCLECSDSTTCTKCVDGKVAQEGSCQDCQAGTYEKNGECITCLNAFGCVTCGEDGRCLECRDDTSLVDGQCQCSRYTQSFNANGECIYCLTKDCETCQAGTSYIMTTCAVCEDPAAGPVDGKCVCPTGQILVDGTCQSCPVPLNNGQCVLCEQLGCKQCSDSVCTQCIDVWWASISEGQCKCSSTESFNAEGFCTICKAEGCKVCEADAYYSYRCHVCEDQNARPVDGVCKCSDGSDIPEGGCVVCDIEDCLMCTNGICSQCVEGKVINQGQCENCPAGKFEQNGACVACSIESCSACSSDTVCTQCEAGKILNGDQSACENCPAGKFEQNGACVACSIESCSACSSDTVCTQCEAGKILNGDQSACENCPAGKFEQNGACVACSIESCSACSSDTVCTQCEAGKILNGDQSACENCPAGKFEQNGACVACSIESCSACSSDTVCTQCEAGKILNGDQSACENCPAGKFEQNGACVACSIESCSACSSDTVCTQCEAGKILNGDQSACENCPAGKFEQNGACVACSIESCSACSSDTVCTQCEAGKILNGDQSACENCPAGKFEQNGACVNCPTGTFQNNGTCSSCPGNCATCSGPYNCTSCSSPHSLLSSSCLSCFDGCQSCSPSSPAFCFDCIESYYFDSYFCFQCPPQCSACSSLTECSECVSPYELSGNQCVLPCSFPCLSCSQNDQDSCLTCFDGYQLVGSTCIQNLSCNQTSSCSGCPKFYSLTKEGHCLPCPDHCRSCQSQICTQCTDGYDLLGVNCYKEGQFSLFGPAIQKYLRKNERLKRIIHQILKNLFS